MHYKSSSQESDIYFLENFIKFGKIIGIIPKMLGKKRITEVLHAIVMILVYCFVVAHYLITGLLPTFDSDILTSLWSTLDWILILSFSIINVICVIYYKENWIILLQNFNKIDDIISTQFISSCQKFQKSIKFKLVISYLIIIVFQIIVFLSDLQFTLWIWRTADFTLNYMRFYVIFVVIIIISMIEERCTKINQHLIETFQYTSKNKQSVNTKIENLKMLIFLVYDNVEQVNLIFGFPILVMFIGAFVDIIAVFCYSFCALIYKSHDLIELIIVISTIVFCFLVPVSIVLSFY